jgi:hypothetical protein
MAMTETGMADADRLARLLELAERAGLELRVLTARAAAEEGAPSQSRVGRVGERVWVLLVPDDPPAHQAAVLAQALGRYRAAFLETCFVPPALRDFIEAATARATTGANRSGSGDR